jgi:ligand-binding SRPBCC domain-containing protein
MLAYPVVFYTDAVYGRHHGTLRQIALCHAICAVKHTVYVYDTYVAYIDVFATCPPPELGFQMVTPQPIHLREGTRIEYRLHLFRVPFAWQSEIQRWNPPEEFVDVQLHGPYKSWIHTHRFREEDGVTIIEDEVQYALPYWPVGELVYPLVRLHLARIFRYRQQATRRYLIEG